MATPNPANVPADIAKVQADLGKVQADLTQTQTDLTQLAADAAAPPVVTVTVPGPVGGLKAAAGSGTAVLSWTAPTTGSPVTTVTVTTSPGNSTLSNQTAVGATVSGLVNGTTYTSTVTPSNSAGPGPASQVTYMPVAPTPPPPPVSSSAMPFSSSSAAVPLFYKPIDQTAALANSSAEIAELVASTNANYGTAGLNTNSFAPTFYAFNSTTGLMADGSAANVVMATMKVLGHSGSAQFTYTFPCPTAAIPDPGGTDHSMVVFDIGAQTIHETWVTTKAGTGSYTCLTAAFSSTANGNGLFARGATWNTDAASGISYGVTMPKLSEAATGAFNHAIPFVMTWTSGKDVYPAQTADGSTSGGDPEGIRLWLPPGAYPDPKTSPLLTMFLAALTNYGAYLVDTAGATCFILENDAPATSAGKPGWSSYMNGHPSYSVIPVGLLGKLVVLNNPTQ